MNDLSFIRLEPNFNDARFTRPSTATSIYQYGQIVLYPNKTYVQTTNTPQGIAFDGNYNVFIIDCNGTELQDITTNVAINERTINGLPQIDFEIVNIGTDYYAKTVYLKFVHTVSDYVWFSNPLNITSYFEGVTTRFNYKNATDTLYQSIDLGCYFTVNDAESQSSEYVTYEGKKLTSRLINTEFEKYIFDKIDNFTYRRLNNLLSRNVVYINGYRMTDKQTIPSKDRAGDTNWFSVDFKVAIDYNEAHTETFQIFPILELIDKIPIDYVTTATDLIGVFNKNVTLNTGNVYIYKEGVLLSTYSEDDITLFDSQFEIDITDISIVGDYSVIIDAGLFTSDLGEVYAGIDNDTDWAFTIAVGEYDNTEYNNDFLIN